MMHGLIQKLDEATFCQGNYEPQFAFKPYYDATLATNSFTFLRSYTV